MPLKEGLDLEKLSDEQLIYSFQDGNHDAYVEIVRRYKDRLTNFIYRYVGSYD